MQKYLLLVDENVAIGFNTLDEAKKEANRAIEEGIEVVYLYEMKLKAEAPKVKAVFTEV